MFLNLVLRIGSISSSGIANLFSDLSDVYSVVKTAFSFDYNKKPTKKTGHRLRSTRSLLRDLFDIYCVGRTVFVPIHATKRTKRRKRRIGVIGSAPHKWFGKKQALLLNAYRTGLRRISLSLTKFHNLKRVNQSIIVACLILIVTAITAPAWFIYWQNHLGQTGQYSEITPYSAPDSSITGKPIGLSIPSLNLELPVIDGRYNPNTHSWTLTNYSVQYMVDSAKPNNIGGKTFMYGHALNNVFGKLPNIQPGAALSLTTDDGYRFNYQFISSFATSPSDLSVLGNTKQPVLYVQTCSGTFYQYRQIFSFKYVGYQKV